MILRKAAAGKYNTGWSISLKHSAKVLSNGGVCEIEIICRCICRCLPLMLPHCQGTAVVDQANAPPEASERMRSESLS